VSSLAPKCILDQDAVAGDTTKNPLEECPPISISAFAQRTPARSLPLPRATFQGFTHAKVPDVATAAGNNAVMTETGSLSAKKMR